MTFEKYKKIHRLGVVENEGLCVGDDVVVVEEKIDGANFRFMIKDDKIIFGSRNQSIGDSTTEISGNFRNACMMVRQVLEGIELKPYEGLIFYCEAMIRHTISYDFYKHSDIIGLDVYDIETSTFLSKIPKHRIFAELYIDPVKVIEITKARVFTEEDVPKSAYYDGLAEGIVIKNYKTQVFGKVVREQFKEMNAKVFGGSKKQARTSGEDEQLLVATFCTNARIDKKIFSYINDGDELHMRLMAKLPKAVYEDIVDEEAKTIFKSNWVINFKMVRKLIAERCKQVLLQMIENSIINKGD